MGDIGMRVSTAYIARLCVSVMPWGYVPKLGGQLSVHASNIPRVAVRAGAHVAFLRVEGTGLSSRASRQIARPGTREEEPRWNRFVGAFFRWTRIFGQRVPWGVLLAISGVSTRGVRAVVLSASVEKIVGPWLHMYVSHVYTST